MAESFCSRCSRPLPVGVAACPACGQPAGGSGSRGVKWVVLGLVGVGCGLIGLALVGIISAIAIPSFFDAMQKAKQKKTLATLRTVGRSLESYRAQAGAYPDAASAAALAAQLAAHGFEGPARDGWEHELRWACLDTDRNGCASYEVASPGRDGVFENEPGSYASGSFALTAYDSDLVLGDGLFTRWPEGQGRFATGDDG